MERKISNSEAETHQIAREFANRIVPGDVICLNGNLGAGKTQFVRGFVDGFGIDSTIVSSPTFTIINEYEGPTPVYHFDFYRLEHYGEALEIGAEEYFYGDGVCIIEWPERILELLPPDCLNITIKSTGKNKREFIFH